MCERCRHRGFTVQRNGFPVRRKRSINCSLDRRVPVPRKRAGRFERDRWRVDRSLYVRMMRRLLDRSRATNSRPRQRSNSGCEGRDFTSRDRLDIPRARDAATRDSRSPGRSDRSAARVINARAIRELSGPPACLRRSIGRRKSQEGHRLHRASGGSGTEYVRVRRFAEDQRNEAGDRHLQGCGLQHPAI